MSYEYDFAERIRRIGKKSEFEAAWYLATCSVKSPLTFSIIDGNLSYKTGAGLTMTKTAANRAWNKGDTAAAILSGDGLLIIDAV